MVWYGRETNLKWIEERAIGVELMKDNFWKSFSRNQSNQMGLVVRRDTASRRWEVGAVCKLVGKMMILSFDAFLLKRKAIK